MRGRLRPDRGRAARLNRPLTAVHQLVAFKAGVFTGFANQSEHGHEHLRGEVIKESVMPFEGQLECHAQVIENATLTWKLGLFRPVPDPDLKRHGSLRDFRRIPAPRRHELLAWSEASERASFLGLGCSVWPRRKSRVIGPAFRYHFRLRRWSYDHQDASRTDVHQYDSSLHSLETACLGLQGCGMPVPQPSYLIYRKKGVRGRA